MDHGNSPLFFPAPTPEALRTVLPIRRSGMRGQSDKSTLERPLVRPLAGGRNFATTSARGISSGEDFRLVQGLAPRGGPTLPGGRPALAAGDRGWSLSGRRTAAVGTR